MTAPLAEAKLTFVDSTEDVLDLQAWLGERRQWLGVDIETSGFDLGSDRIRLIQFGDAMRGWAIPIEGFGLGHVAKRIIETYEGRFVMHNAIFDSGFLLREGIEIPMSRCDDTMVMAHIHQSGYSQELKPLARRWIGEEASALQSALKEAMDKQGWDWDTVPIDFPAFGLYGALDPVLTVRMAEILWPLISKYHDTYDIEMGAISVLRQASLTGMRIDVAHAKAESLRLEAELAQLEPGLPCNPNSNPQLAVWMKEKGAVTPYVTKKGNPSINDETLALNEKRIPECKTIREYRKRDKLKNSYFDNMLEMHVDGVVHPSVRILGAEKTGRMSITRPAMQTLPKSKVGRSAFLAREGHKLIAADFDGQELRLLAHMAGETALIRKFEEGLDPHRWIASEVYHVSEEEVSKAQRSIAKNAAYAKSYGAGIPKFAWTAKIDEAEAQRFMDMYDAMFPRIAEFIGSSGREVHDVGSIRDGEHGFGRVTTWTGRSLMVPSNEAYKSVNYKIQGGCAELTKWKLSELANAGLGEYVRLPVHDEIIFEAPVEIATEVGEEAAAVMTETTRFDVPFTVSPAYADRWGDLYE